MKGKRILRNIITLSLLCMISILATSTISNATNDIEDEFKSFINRYDSKEVVVEDGISLKMGEKLDLSKYPNWELSNTNTVSISEDGIVTPIKGGTVFLSQEIQGKIYIVEIYVSKNISTYNSNKKEATQKRSYYKVFIDAGHGGSDSGATAFGRLEKDLNLEISKILESKLKEKGIEVKMSRSTDVYYSLSQRAQMANEYGADVFVSIHQNSFTEERANGIETLYQDNKSWYKPLSSDIQTNLIKQTSATDRGVKARNLGVLRESNMPSSLVECGFITNEFESNQLASASYQEKLASAIATGVETYLKNNINVEYEEEMKATGSVVNTSSLNVRSGYGTSYSIIGTLSQGSKVDIVAKKDGWYKIVYGGGYGYVSASYISLDASVNPPVIQFTDTKNHWAEKNIIDFASKGYIGGYEDNTFRPNDNITRAEFVKIVNKVFGFTDVGEQNFTDIQSSNWYYNDICIAMKAGYIKGYEDNTFRPNNSITREEAALIVQAITNLNGDGVISFKDNDKIAPWSKDAVDALNDNNIMGGYEDNTFRPKNNITRAEAVSTLSRISK